MPVSARKSSLGAARRGPQKYIRYRADDLQHGKRTGIAVGYVELDSDDFEPFDKVIGQADLRTPPKPNLPARRKKTAKTPVANDDDEDDEDGEMSMDLEDSIPNSPAAYFRNGVGTITSSVQRIGSSSRPIPRRSHLDFDHIPSPRRDSYLPLSARKSFSQSRSFAVHDQDQEEVSEPEPINYSPPPEDDPGEQTPPGSEQEEEEEEEEDHDRTPVPSYRQSAPSSRASAAHTSHGLTQHEDEEEEDEVEVHMTAKSNKAKGKSRQLEVQDQDQDMEEEIAQGLDDVDNMPEEEFDYEGEQQQEQGAEEDEAHAGPQKDNSRRRAPSDSPQKDERHRKKARFDTNDENAGQKKRPGRPRKNQTVLREVVHDQNVDDDGLRRSHRMRYKPLEWWRCEKVVYGRRDSGTCLVPTIKEIQRFPKEETLPLGARHRRRGRHMRAKSRSITADYAEDMFNPEEGWDDDTDPTGVVLQYPTDTEVSQRVAFTAKMVNPKPAANAQFSFQKIFGDGGFMAAGQLIIPPGGAKPTKGTKDNTFIFYVIEGAVTFKVHRTSFVIATGGMFMVPRGNMYFIQNISERDAKLFFAQARKSDDSSRDASESRTPVPRADRERDAERAKVPMKRTKRREEE